MNKVKSVFLNLKNKLIGLPFKKKIGLAILLVVIFLVVLISIFMNFSSDFSKNKKNSLKAITTPLVVKEEEYNGLKFDNVVFIKEKGIYTMTLNVTNTTSSDIDLEKVTIDIKDKDENVIGSLLGYIGDSIKPNETRVITASSSTDFSKAYSKVIRS